MSPFHRTAGVTAFIAFALWTVFCVGAYALVGFAGDLLSPSSDPSGGVSDILGFLTGIGFFVVVTIWLVGSGLIAFGWKMSQKMLNSAQAQRFQGQFFQGGGFPGGGFQGGGDRFGTMRDVTPRRPGQGEPIDR